MAIDHSFVSFQGIYVHTGPWFHSSTKSCLLSANPQLQHWSTERVYSTCIKAMLASGDWNSRDRTIWHNTKLLVTARNVRRSQWSVFIW